MHITEMHVENVMNLKVIDWKPGRHMNVVGGVNESGKTSLLRSIEMLFSGASALGPMPIRRGADSMKIHVELEGVPGKGLTIERTKDAATGRDSLIVKGEEGQSYGTPQGVLNAIKNSLLDPLAFSRMDSKKQRKVLMELLGLDFTELDAKYKGAFDTRADHNREVKRLKATLKPMKEPAEFVDVAELSKELGAAHDNNSERRAAKQTAIDLNTQAEAIAKRIDELKAELEDVNSREHHAATFAAGMKHIDTDPIQSKIDAAGEINARATHNKTMDETIGHIESEQDFADECSRRLVSIENEKTQAIADAKPPIEGLAVADNCVTFNGIPLENCSGEETLRISFAIMAGLNPQLKVALIQDGSLLDDEHLIELEKMCEEFGIQAIVERVGTGDECALVIEDGEAVEALTK